MPRFDDSSDGTTPAGVADAQRDLDPGAYIGQDPELASETIPGGVRPEDDRVAFNASRRAVDGEPGMDKPADPPAGREAGQNR